MLGEGVRGLTTQPLTTNTGGLTLFVTDHQCREGRRWLTALPLPTNEGDIETVTGLPLTSNVKGGNSTAAYHQYKVGRGH